MFRRACAWHHFTCTSSECSDEPAHGITLHVQVVNAQTSLRMCAGSYEHSLLADAIRSKICAGSYKHSLLADAIRSKIS